MAEEQIPADVQKKYIQVEMLNQELEQLMSQRELVAMKSTELQVLRDSLGKLVIGEGFAQLGEGVYVPAKFTDSDRLVVDIGRNLHVKMKRSEAEKFLGDKLKAYVETLGKIDKRIESVSGEVQKLAMELQPLA